MVLLIVVLAARPQAQSRTLDIYWVDVEGGAATLFVAPSGESMLIDTGFDVGDRDAQRIAAAAKTAGLRRIDHVIISHYHTDHVGGLAALAKLIPLGRIYSPGDKIEPANQKWLDVVRATAGDRRTIVKPGDKVPLSGVEVQIVASDEALIAQPLRGGGPNPLCATAEEKAPAGFENQRMVGTHLRFGTFTFLALIDLDWQKEMELACPVNRLGAITLYQSGRHGSFDGAGAPALLNAIKPQVVVINNGPRKGLGQTDANAKVATPAGRKVDAVRAQRLRAADADSRDRGRVAGPLVAARQGTRPQHGRRHDRQHRRDGRLQGTLDQSVRAAEWPVHGDERQKRLHPHLHGAQELSRTLVPLV